jgi:hypothetical protein
MKNGPGDEKIVQQASIPEGRRMRCSYCSIAVRRGIGAKKQAAQHRTDNGSRGIISNRKGDEASIYGHQTAEMEDLDFSCNKNVCCCDL